MLKGLRSQKNEEQDAKTAPKGTEWSSPGFVDS